MRRTGSTKQPDAEEAGDNRARNVTADALAAPTAVMLPKFKIQGSPVRTAGGKSKDGMATVPGRLLVESVDTMTTGRTRPIAISCE